MQGICGHRYFGRKDMVFLIHQKEK